jgi:MEMO1 family protein
VHAALFAPVAALLPATILAQAMNYAGAAHPPSLAEVRKEMAIPSTDDVRGQRDATGYASTAAQMARVWELSAAPPPPESLGPAPPPGVAGVICPHDDYLYAGRVDRTMLPLVTARTVVIVGVFHRYRLFAAHDTLVFAPYRAWRAPDGEIPVSPLRGELLAALPPGGAVQDAAMHDSEHSVEAIAYWLKHIDPDVEIVPILVPAARFERFQQLAGQLGAALATSMRSHGWKLGRDVAVVISADAVHYGADFDHTPFGAGGIEVYTKACARDRALLTGPLSGTVDDAHARAFFAACVNPDDPGRYTLTWCGRFSIPFGLLLLARTAADLHLPAPMAHPVAYATSVGTPELPVRDIGMGATAPDSLYHFVGYPGVAITVP